MHGKFITIEGTEGVGKTTNIEFIQTWLNQQQVDFVTTREPGGTPLAEQIRELLLTPRDEKVCNSAELLLMFAGRAQHLDQVIVPAIQSGLCVVCDRFTDATYAYQGFGRGMDSTLIAHLERLVQAELRPDLTLILDIPVEIGLQRASQRSAPDRFEREQTEFFERVRQGYLSIAANEPERCVVIDASQPLEDVQRDITTALKSFFMPRQG
ncbi:MAG: Thymidylate kinase [Porticoccaceae bacterium UBA1117]|jgi:dTMP kinase|nr:dTMP kinase [Porticoccaceae bacterium]CAI8381083.1 MAG: Thymidylate kinase [Porticoccaceae bacterium UBA1117]